MELAVAAVLKEVNNDDAPLFRIIWIDNKSVYCIDLTPPHKMPYKKKRSEIQELLDNGFLAYADDPFFKLPNEENIKERDRIARDKKLEYVSFVFDENKQRFLSKSKRKALFEEAAEKFNVSEVYIRRTVSRYLQRGMCRSALLSDYENVGGKGKEKADTIIKRGRPRKRFGKNVEGPGINVTNKIKKQIHEIIVKYYMSSEQPSLTDAYHEYLEKYCSDIYYENGLAKVRIWGEDKIITYYQFYYHAKKILSCNKSTTLIKRLGQNKFNKDFDSLLGDKTRESFGPGFKAQIDATRVRVFCVSAENPDCFVGTPTCYLIPDVMSHFVMGMYVGLENPSWIGAAMAINNIVEDKVEYCARYGIDITPEMWPSSFRLMERLLADNAEFAGNNPLQMVADLGVTIETAPPYRGDCKGRVERLFGTIKEGLKLYPGASIKQMRERGEIDVRYDAIMTVDEVTRAIIREVIFHNTTVIKNYDKGEFAIREPIRVTPVDIWNWGIQNRSCGLIYRDPNMVKLATMPRGEATITREGIKFENRFYSCKEAIDEEWFITPKKTKITIAHDPRTMEQIYIPSEDGRSYITCKLLNKDRFYAKMHYDDYKALIQYNINEKAMLEHEKLQGQVDKHVAHKQDVKEAKRRKQKYSQSAKSKTAKVRELKTNRNIEKEKRRKVEAFVLDTDKIEEESKVLLFKTQQTEPDKSKAFEERIYDYLLNRGDDEDIE